MQIQKVFYVLFSPPTSPPHGILVCCAGFGVMRTLCSKGREMDSFINDRSSGKGRKLEIVLIVCAVVVLAAWLML